MAIEVLILEGQDAVRGDDWCRPLRLRTTGWGDEVMPKSMAGTPSNNVKWVRVMDVLGPFWQGRTVSMINSKVVEMEFARGEVPLEHRLDMSDYHSCAWLWQSMVDEDCEEICR